MTGPNRSPLPLALIALAALVGNRPTSAAPQTPYWFKTYSTAPYKETWTGVLSVRSFDADLAHVLQAIDKAGGKLTQPLGNFVSSKKDQIQQLSFMFPQTKGKDLLKALRKIGDLPGPSVRASGAPIPLDEVKAKIDLLMKEKTERVAELSKLPASAAAAEEILEHLLLVEEVGRSWHAQVLFNLQVQRQWKLDLKIWMS